ncbi:serine protease [Streptomyces sp. NBC_01565]|uniref:S1 family peptidase n=1 Tax=unclassified Streptomyces TaxID=2593676 RepID=UPI002251DAD7|nr:serine protease [Streptomyces sp. NBC_01565]MCX4545631.1 serine protease [Streptomyces sp. NBC_01565]
MFALNRRTAAAAFTASVLATAGLAAVATPAAAIHGGQNTTTADHPYAMLLQTSAGAQVCGGTLVAPTKVLTAAHCVTGSADPLDLRVVGGRTDMGSAKGTVREIASVKVHPKYAQNTLTYDAAVLTLSAPMPYKPLPVAGPKDSALYTPGKTGKTLGWGRTAPNTPGTRLKSAELTLSPLASCEPYTDPGESGALKVCGVGAVGTQDSICPGDSGGPLVAGGKVIGIVSTGNKYCDDQYPVSVYTRVSAVAAGLGLPVS